MGNRVLRDWTDSEKMHGLSVESERFFTRLIMKVDDFGCYTRNAKLIRSTLFPLSTDTISLESITAWLKECSDFGLIICYDIEDKQYLQILDFGQRLRVKKSKYPPPNSTHHISDPPGYVYLIGIDYDSPIKIGYSLNPWSRVKEISTGSHQDLNVLLTFKGDKKTESLIHKLLQDYRTKNEWFKIPKDIIDVMVGYSKNTDGNIIDKLRSSASLIRSLPELETNSKQESEEETNGVCALVDLDPTIVKKADDLTTALCEYFAVKTIVTSPVYNSVCEYVSTLSHRNELDIGALALQKYMTYKARSQEQVHGIKSWIGTIENHYRDGQWIMTDWNLKDKNYIPRNGTGTKRISGQDGPEPGKDYAGGF